MRRAISGWFGEIDPPLTLIFREFAPGDRRISTAARVVVMCVTTAVVLEIMHIDSEIGALTV